MTARWIVGLVGILSLLVGTEVDAAPPAAFTVAAGTSISPANADAWYCAQASTCTNSGTRDFWVNHYPVEITALAAALHNDADLIYEYVRNNIEIVPIYGLQKGALGALIDRSGTAYDQAQLMVELLRTSGYTASYVQGTITLTGTQIQQWLGVTDATALTQIFADGGIPGTVSPSSGTVTSATLEHIWVQVALPAKGANAAGTYVFDPSFKPHTFTSKVDIGAASGWSDTTFLAAGQDTMVSGTQTAPSDVPPNANISIPYITNVDETKLESQLTTYATALETYLKTHGSVSGQVYAQEQLDDVIGRQDIVWATGTLRQSALTYAAAPTPHAAHTWSGNIPDVYRVKVTIEMLDLSQTTVRLSQTLFADEIYGRKINYDTYLGTDTWTDDHIQLRVDGIYVGSPYAGSDSPGARTGYVRLSIDHPYAANGGTYLDLTGTNALVKQADFVSPVGIVLGLGDTSDRLAAKLATEQVYDKLLPPSTYYGSSCEALNKPDQPAQESTLARAYAGWLAQYSRMASIQSRMLASTHVQHHTLGLAYRRSLLAVANPHCAPQAWSVGEGELVLDLDTAVSVDSNTAVTNDRRTLARSLAAAADTLEAAQFEQLSGTATPASVGHRFEWNTNNAANARYFLVQPGGNSTSLFPTGPTPYFWPSIYAPVAVYTNAGYKVIVAENEFMGPGRDCATPPCTSVPQQPIFHFERGGAFEAFSSDGVTTAHIVTDQTSGAIKGGSAGDPPNYDETFKADQSADLLKDQFKDRSDDFGVALSSGEFTHGAGTDLSVGLGDFPYKLSWERTFKSGESYSPGMGKGWSHNLDIRVNLTTSGAAAFGQETTLGAASTLIALYATQRIYATEPTTDDAYLRRWVLTPFVQGWWAGQMRFNTVSYTAGSATKTFVRLPDGHFNPAGGYDPGDGSSTWNLQQSGSVTGYGVHFAYGGVSFTLTSPSKDVQTFGYYGRPNRDYTNPYLYGAHHGWHVTGWSFPQGISLSFNYVPVDLVNYTDDHLVSVSNSLGRQLNFHFAGNSSWQQCNIQSVDDNQGDTVSFDCVNNTVASPVGDLSKYTYGPLDCGLGVWPDHTLRPRCDPYLSAIFGPSDPNNAKIELTYDAVGRVNSYADAVAVEFPSTRNPYNFFVTGGTRGERQDPAGYFYTVYYDPWTRPLTFTNEMNATSSAKYDGLNHVTERTTAEGIVTDFLYDPRGNVAQLTQTPKQTVYLVPATLTTSATYDPGCGKLSTVTDPNGNPTVWTYNSTTCLVSQIKQPPVPDGRNNGVSANPITQFSYTSVGLLDTLTDPTGLQTKNSYDASGNRTEVQIDPTGFNVTTTYGYDAVGNITSVTDGRNNTTGYSYDPARRVIQVTAPATTCGITQNTWQGGLVTKVRHAKICTPTTDANWQVWVKSYTPTDKINVETDPDNGTVTTSYDPVDRPEYVSQSLGSGQENRVTHNTYYADGQLQQVYRGWGETDQITYSTYAYSADGRLSSSKDANGNTTSLDYDGYGRLAKTTFPLGTFELYSHDSNGNMLVKTNRSGKTVTMVYDALNRESSRTVQANAAGFDRYLTTTYDLASRKYDLTADGQTLSQRYDSAGRLHQVLDSLLNTLGASIGNISYTYDAASNRNTMSFTTAQGLWTATYSYDDGERLSNIVNAGSTLVQNGYDPLSRISSVSFLDTSSVGYAYEADDDLQTLTHTYAGGSLTLGFTHNGAHQITSMTTSDPTYLMEQGATTTYTANALNQYSQVGTASPGYDANGNLISDGTATYKYDEENRLRQIVSGGVTTTYLYDPLGRRRSKAVGSSTTYFVNDGQNELAELSATGSRLRLYLNGMGADSRLGMYDDSGGTGWRFYHLNHQGSVLFTSLAGSNGGLADQYQYGPFGEPKPGGSLTGNPIRYTGRYLDAESGLYYYRARFYSPTMGRFLQTDSIGGKDDLNLYGYVHNDPLNHVDATGKATTCTESGKTTQCTITADTFNAAHSNGQTTVASPEVRAAADAGKSQVAVSSGDKEKVGFVVKGPDEKSEVQSASNVKTSDTNTGSMASAKIPAGAEAVIHGHIDSGPNRSNGMVDDPKLNGGYGDTQPLKAGLPNATVSNGQVGWHEIVNGQLQFTYPGGALTSSQNAAIQQNLNNEQQLFQVP